MLLGKAANPLGASVSSSTKQGNDISPIGPWVPTLGLMHGRDLLDDLCVEVCSSGHRDHPLGSRGRRDLKKAGGAVPLQLLESKGAGCNRCLAGGEGDSPHLWISTPAAQKGPSEIKKERENGEVQCAPWAPGQGAPSPRKLKAGV